MPYTTIDKSTDHFNLKLNTGDGTTNKSFTGFGFQPDMVWNKIRSTSYAHWLYDAVRGAGAEKEISPNGTAGMGDNDNEVYGYISSFDSDGFSVTGSSNSSYFNQSSETYVNWYWKANGQGSANNDGSINTTYTSANTTAGISIIQYSGDGNNGATIGHGLGVAPKLVMIKRTDTTSNWIVGEAVLGFNKFSYLNEQDTATTNAGPFNDTAPSSSVITLGTWNDVNNSSGTYICYAFAKIAGFSDFGTYTGNGNADGPFVYTGFKPAFVMVKNTSASNNWFIQDNLRAGYNATNYLLKPNTNGAEDTGTHIDIYSNGFKTRVNSANCNGSGNIMTYIAFAGAPLVGSNNIPATAR